MVAAAAKGSTQVVLKPILDVWDSVVLPHLEGWKDRISDRLAVERQMRLVQLGTKWETFI
jgi:hypothetical protein